MSPARTRLFLNATAIGAMTVAGAGGALAAETPLLSTELTAGTAKVELIESSRLGCVASVAGLAPAANSQCAFDNATSGARIAAKQDWSKGSIEAYATVAHATAGAFTPDQLLVSPGQRTREATDLIMVGLKGSAFADRVRFTTEFASTKRVVEDLLGRDWTLADSVSDSGSSAMARLEAKLVDRPRLKWAMTAEFRSTSEDFALGRSNLSLYAAMPGTRMALSSRARIGDAGLNLGIDQTRTSHGRYTSRKAGIDLYGVSLRLVDRDSSMLPFEGSSLTGSRTQMTSTYVDLDSNMLASSLMPELDELPFLVPATVNISFRSGETENLYADRAERFDRSSFGLDGTWETPAGETMLSYWRDSRTGLTPGAQSRSSDTLQLSHFVRLGGWRFGLDAALVRGTGEGAESYGERSWSFGQSVAYSTPGGPEFRLSLGQDRGVMRMADDSYAFADHYSQVTASLDLSRYLQKRFDRSDLRLTLDYRKAIQRSDSEAQFDELVERWVEGDRREGLLMSFGMKL